MMRAGILNKALRANAFSFLVIAKFAGLVLWGFSGLSDEDYFGQYALCLGLVNVFYVMAGMRGRIFVLQAITSKADFKQFSLLMFVLGAIASGAVAILNQSSSFLILILLIAMTKFGDIFLLANASFQQQKLSRDSAFNRLNLHGWMVIFGFFLMLPFGLIYAVIAEICILAGTLSFQFFAISKIGTGGDQPRGIVSIFKQGMEFTFTASLNAGLTTFFVYYSASNFDQDVIYLVAKIFAVQAVFVRIIGGNSIYFRSEIGDQITKVQSQLLVAAGVFWFGAIVFQFLIGADVSVQVQLLVIGGCFTIVNGAQTMVRQHVLLGIGPRRMGLLHMIELIVVVGISLGFQLAPEMALLFYGSVRLMRMFALTQPWFASKEVS